MSFEYNPNHQPEAPDLSIADVAEGIVDSYLQELVKQYQGYVQAAEGVMGDFCEVLHGVTPKGVSDPYINNRQWERRRELRKQPARVVVNLGPIENGGFNFVEIRGRRSGELMDQLPTTWGTLSDTHTVHVTFYTERNIGTGPGAADSDKYEPTEEWREVYNVDAMLGTEGNGRLLDVITDDNLIDAGKSVAKARKEADHTLAIIANAVRDYPELNPQFSQQEREPWDRSVS